MTWWQRIAIALVVASATAAAAPSADQIAATDAAQVKVTSADKAVRDLAVYHQQLAAHFAEQTQTIDRLKQRKRSWRHDDELNAAQADANDTAKKLQASERDLSRAQQIQTDARRVLVSAIDAELGAGETGTRADQLAKVRGHLVAQVAPAAKKIIIPNADIDETADPEELDAQATALRQAEKELESEKSSLTQNADELDKVAKVQKEHNRANELSQRDDDGSHRTTTTGHTGNGTQSLHGGAGAGSGGGEDSSNNPVPTGGGSSGGGASPADPTRGVEAEATVVLADVVDASTLDGLRGAQRSNDPATRAAAAKKASDVVGSRIDELRKKRQAIEARAKRLRKK